jgi:uncharacterized protein (DUF1800 family)
MNHLELESQQTELNWSATEVKDAWSPVDRAGSFRFETQHALHLLRRAGFGGSSAEVNRCVEQGLEKTLASLFKPSQADEFETEAQAMIRTALVLGDTDQLADWWLYRMVHDPFALREKATLFWHGHFCTSRDKVPDSRLLLAQNDLLRRHALGSFPALVKDISRDPAMLIYLDSTENQKSRPNENYARELLELFCLGLGNYTERDIKELARCFTGWEVRRQRFRFSSSAHDTGEKTLFNQRTSLGGDEAIEIVLQQPAAARYIAERLIRFYCTHDPLPHAVVHDLGRILTENQWQLEPTLAVMFSSQFFFSPRVMQRQVASPVSWTIAWLKSLERSVDFRVLRNALGAMGQVPLEPPNVKGWPGGAKWIDPARIAARIQWVQHLSDSSADLPSPISQNSSILIPSKHADISEAILSWVENYLLGRILAAPRREQLLAACQAQPTKQAAFRVALQAAGVMPESQIF